MTDQWKDDDRPRCDHDEQSPEIRLYVDRGGRNTYYYQCMTCGQKVGNQIAHRDVPNISSVPPYDEDLAEKWNAKLRAYWEEKRLRYDRDREEEKAQWDRDYNRYLTSAKWADKRARVLERDNYLCQACRRRTATQVHHLTYKNVFDEPLFDLVAICDVCHNAISPVEEAV
jgi:hypothetical protein